jgi:hypothetical protein
MASTLLNEQGFHPDLIELQLAHAERNKVRAAYNKAQRLAERRKNDVDVGRFTSYRKGRRHPNTAHLITLPTPRIIPTRADVPIRAKYTAANDGSERSDHY